MKLSAVFAGIVASASAALDFDTKEFVSLGRANPNARLMFTAALPARNTELLDSMLSVISNPKRAEYGQWLSQKEVNDLTAPDASVREEVRSWVTSTGAKCIDWPTSLRCSATATQVEKLLNTRLTAFHHVPRDRVVHRVHPDEAYTFPAHLAGKLSFITNLADFPSIKKRHGSMKAFETDAAGRALQVDYSVVYETLDNFYKLTGISSGSFGSQKSTVAPAEFQGDTSWATSDLQQFAQQNSFPVWNVSKIVGPFNPTSPDTEATLDYQYIGATGFGNQQWYWTENDWMYEFVENLKTLPDASIPKVFSMSWGWWEGDQCTISQAGPCGSGSEPTNSYAFVSATNAGFMAVTARGITFTASSGDSGAHGRTDPSCSTPTTRATFPAGSPYVTAVGATQIVNGVQVANPQTPYCQNPSQTPCAQSGTEVVCSTATGALITSGGGFSNVAARPAWQDAAVAAYLKSGAKLPPNGAFNASGRGYPDVAALGHNYVIWLGGPMQVDGTSCSSPVFAGLVAQLNAIRVNAGKPVLGFINQLVYQWGAEGLFNDVTSGDNSCTEDGCSSTCTGFGAVKGWNAATGWGTPNFQKLAAAVKALP